MTRPTDAAHARQLLQGPPGSKVEVQLANGATLTVTRSRGSGAFAPGGIPEFSPSASIAKP